MSYQELKKIATNTHLKQIYVVFISLNFVEQHPEYLKNIGCLWISDTVFLINVAIFGLFTDRKPNTINKNFKYNKFATQKITKQTKKIVPEKYNFNHLPDQQNWFFKCSINFSKNMNDLDLLNPRSFPTPIINVYEMQGPNANDSNERVTDQDSSIQLPNIEINDDLLEDANESIDEFDIFQINSDDQNDFEFFPVSVPPFDSY